jgi:hypothetical protein
VQARVFVSGGQTRSVNVTTESLCSESQFVYAGTCVDCPVTGAGCSDGIIKLLPEHWYNPDYGPLAEFWGKRNKGEIASYTNIYRCAKDACTTKNGLPACRKGRKGALCAECEDDYFITEQRTCKKCPASASADKAAWALVALVALCGALWVLKCKIEKKHPKLAYSMRTKLPEVLKLLTGLMQILGSFAVVLYRVPWPDAFTNVMGFFSFLNLDLFALPSIRCSGIASTSFARFTLHVTSCLAITAIFVALLSYAYSKHNIARGKPIKSSTVWNTFLPFLFLIYPSISKTVILMLRCRTVDGVSYLLSDISVSCETAEYVRYYWFAVFGVLAFPIGIVVFFTALVGLKRDKLPPDWWPGGEKEKEAEGYEAYSTQCSASDSANDWEPHLDEAGNVYFWSESMQHSSWIDPSAAGTDGAPAKPFEEWKAEIWTPQMAKYDKIFKRTGFLTSTYTKQYWWFESLVTIYKLAMTVLVMFVSGGDENKILCGMLGATAMLAFYSFYQPFRHRDILSINTGAQLVVLTVLFAAMYLLQSGGGNTFFAVVLVCLTLAPLGAGVVLTLRLPQDAIVRVEAGDALSKDISNALKETLSSGKLGASLGKMSRLVARKRRGGRSGEGVASTDSPWSEHKDGEGRTYFLNSKTGESSWVLPTVTAAEALPQRALRMLHTAMSSVCSALCGAMRALRSAASRLCSVLRGLFSGSTAASHEWAEHRNAEGRAYYLNQKTGQSSWERPAASPPTSSVASSAAPTASSDWKEHRNEEGRAYYLNGNTGESSWEPPTAAAEAPQLQPLRVLRSAAGRLRTALCNALGSTPEPAARGNEWTEELDADGNIYFHNARTSESSWEQPAPSAPAAAAASPLPLRALHSAAHSLRRLLSSARGGSMGKLVVREANTKTGAFSSDNPMHRSRAVTEVGHNQERGI